MHFESIGLFIGLVSFPFSVDGKELYDGVFKDFFLKHKASAQSLSAEDIADSLYRPHAYRMLGSHGLAILSLIDDYAFGCRIFNPGHIDTDIPDCAKFHKYKSTVLTGSSETAEKGKGYLYDKATHTFLADKNKYPFIGIIRLKIDYHLLQNRGVTLTRKVKDKIEALSEQYSCRCIVVDTYDSDEMAAIGFSSSLKHLYEYLLNIRRLSILDLGLVFNESNKYKKHIFSACHMSYGFDIDFSFKTDLNSFISHSSEDINCTLNCLCETKPGHHADCKLYLEKELHEIKPIGLTLTGGSLIHIQIPITEVELLQSIAKKTDFSRHVRRIKLTLNDSEYRANNLDNVSDIKHYQNADDIIIRQDSIRDIKDALKEIGVSKIVRDRLLALIDLYNDCSSNKLQMNHFVQLKGVLLSLKSILQNFLDSNLEICDIERVLNDEITAFETAFYNRICNKMSPNTILEYSGGVQQYLQAYGYAYNVLISILNHDTEGIRPIQYTCITGEEKVSSVRNHLELNINHIIYPQLFATTAWKEASNFANEVLDNLSEDNEQFKNNLSKEGFHSIQRLAQLINSPHTIKAIKQILSQKKKQTLDSEVYSIVINLFDSEFIKYTISDYIVYHFAFQRNFKHMWHFYFKILLQTSSAYHHLNILKRRTFIFVIMRLFFVAMRDIDNISFIKEHIYRPFDHIMGSLWLECYSKVLEICEYIYDEMGGKDYALASEALIIRNESEALYLKQAVSEIGHQSIPEINKRVTEIRQYKTNLLYDKIRNSELAIDKTIEDAMDNTICLLNAYLKYIYTLDSTQSGIIRSVPRDVKGNIKIPETGKGLTPILSDPIGGFYIYDQGVRLKYFACRTVLHRTLWHLSYINHDINS